MKKILVQATFNYLTEVPDDFTMDDALFVIEENSCPGTRGNWESVKKNMDSAGVCFFCGSEGKNKIVAVGDVEIEKAHPGIIDMYKKHSG